MALSDRHYLRQDFNTPRMTKALIWILIGAFVLQSLFLYYGDRDAIGQLGLTLDGLSRGKIWQLFTFQFLHSCPWPFHVLFNCLGLWFFGRPVEETIGSKRFLRLYFLSALAGGILQALLTLLLPRHADIPVVGASAGVCGMIAIFCMLYPMQELTTWIYFFPIQIRARYLLIFLAALSVFGALVPFDGIAHAAHLGGIIVGVVYVRWGGVISTWSERILPGKLEYGLKLRTQSASSDRFSFRKPNKSPRETFISKEVDPILDKISAHGFESLTEEERKVLDAARKKLR